MLIFWWSTLTKCLMDDFSELGHGWTLKFCWMIVSKLDASWMLLHTVGWCWMIKSTTSKKWLVECMSFRSQSILAEVFSVPGLVVSVHNRPRLVSLGKRIVKRDQNEVPRGLTGWVLDGIWKCLLLYWWNQNSDAVAHLSRRVWDWKWIPLLVPVITHTC